MTYIKLVIFVLTWSLFQPKISIGQQDPDAQHYSSLITSDRLRQHIRVLASDSLEGRETAHEGMNKAAAYVAGVFRENGLVPGFPGSYYQNVPLVNFSKGKAECSLNHSPLLDEEEFIAGSMPVSFDKEFSEIVVAGYGIKDEKSGWNDWNELEVSGKAVMIFDGDPVNKKKISRITGNPVSQTDRTERRKRMEEAINNGAAAVLFVTGSFDVITSYYKRRKSGNNYELITDEIKAAVPGLYIPESVADKMILASGQNPSRIRKHLNAHGFKRKDILLKTKIHIKADFPVTSCNNVAGMVEGYDKKGEAVVVSAHLDHLGKRGDAIYYGADDDGSGSAAVLNLAEAFAKMKADGNGPQRNILFITFTGEEKGLLGSAYYTNHPAISLDSTIANLNIDMIGRTDTLHGEETNYTYLIGSDKVSTELHNINEQANERCCNLKLDYKYNAPDDKLRLYYRSDHYNFAEKGIPVIFYFTGLHADYHKPTDTPDKINYEKMVPIVKLVFTSAWELSNRDRLLNKNITRP